MYCKRKINRTKKEVYDFARRCKHKFIEFDFFYELFIHSIRCDM